MPYLSSVTRTAQVKLPPDLTERYFGKVAIVDREGWIRQHRTRAIAHLPPVIVLREGCILKTQLADAVADHVYWNGTLRSQAARVRG